MRARIRDTEIYFDVEGMGLVPDGPTMRERPVAFVLHGGPGGDHSGFKPGFSPLAERMQLVYIDHRGQGRSAKGDPATYTLDENVEDLEALRQHLGLGRIVSIGTSYGGMVAMAHAARYPDSVSHLVLVVTAAHAGFNDRARAIVAERGTPEQIRVADQLWNGELTSLEAVRHYYAVMGPLYSVTHNPEAGRDARLRTLHEPAALMQAFRPGGFLRGFDLRPELPRITAKTLILAGRHDWICAPEFSEEIHRLIPGSDLRIFERSSHSIRADEPQAMFDAIKGFLVY
ncbi:alpha/beta fold hydrolase [Teichococcus cervicalis]|uniref:Proline-specific peptidase n=1 Tax=Pseudoroseomonas cervicalis ATCC 49957 TaxID=525371 RepID=D5RMS9_9PROT|nr:alpha/beta fold hydrolase [Pseudoroseomonas cervicalis]EFH11393.1 proline-specific peptidase [Pseudoroseomonas cervicalis ATCC 49957]